MKGKEKLKLKVWSEITPQQTKKGERPETQATAPCINSKTCTEVEPYEEMHNYKTFKWAE
jgi:hypothetical protein